jgi:hypothetical protein
MTAPNSLHPGGLDMPSPAALAERLPGVASASNLTPGASCAGGSFHLGRANVAWTEEEKESLRCAWRDPAWSLADMQESFRRSISSIQSKAVDLNLGGRPRAGGLGACHPLSPKEQARILELRDAGMTRKAIAAEMKRGCRLIAAFLNANSPTKPEPKPKAPTLAAIRGAKWWEPLPPFHPIAAAELERAREIEL